ncbi:MAG: Dipeptidase [Anaerolineae bacterium]|jgi:dipeptidase|nr:MAG: Dipeptidase [Anaerolineae bacterium]
MCDSFVALSNVTQNGTVIFAKSADCEVNEANAIVRIPRQKHVKGEAVRLTHLVIPQAEETYEVFLTKAFWTYGAEIGINEYGLAMGEEAVYTTEMHEEQDGVIGPDLVRLGLERAKNCQEALQVMIDLLEKYGQGGSAELKGNSHFDSSFLMADSQEAYILETAGRNWAIRKIDSFDSISNLLTISDNYTRCSLTTSKAALNWAQRFALPEYPPNLGSVERQTTTYQALKNQQGKITVKTFFEIMRHHGEGYHPATATAHRNICVHAGPQENRWWQADGVMVTEVGEHGVIAWVTGTSGTCVSIFKPVFLGVELPDIGPVPTEHFDPRSLWWKHELLHRRAMADFENLVPEIRKDFDIIEEQFLAEAETVKKGTLAEKKDFMDYCFAIAMQATERWIATLRARKDLKFKDEGYRAMWQKLNAEAGLVGLPA